MTTHATESIGTLAAVPIQLTNVVPPDIYETADRLGVLQYLASVIALTEEIYGSLLKSTVSYDPEFADTHILLHVPASGSIDEELDKSGQWGIRLREMIPVSPRVYLICPEFAE
jgi:hypothetical protein